LDLVANTFSVASVAQRICWAARSAMESWRRSGDFRARERRAERATVRRGVQQRSRAAAQTHDAIDRFEDVLKIEQEKQNRDIDDLPAEADAGTYGNTYGRSLGASTYGGNASHGESSYSNHDLMRSHSDPQVRVVAIDNDTCAQRPPSPLTYYDYGSLSTKPRSVFAQHKSRMGESTRQKYRQTSCGFYFPGPQFKQGPYGFSMLDPCMLAPRSWPTKSGVPPVRQAADPGDLRPLDTEDLGHKRNRVDAPVISDIVRTTRAHNERALMANRSVDKHREEKLLEQVRFEKGMYEGTFRDPMTEEDHLLKRLPVECAPEQHDWLALDHGELQETQQLGSRILFGVQGCLRNCRGRITDLFRAENILSPSGCPTGQLEPIEFLYGLVRLGVVEDGEFSEENIVHAMTVIDPNFDGRVSLPVIARALNAAHKVDRQRIQATQQLEKQHQNKLSTSYCESLPVEVVKVDMESRSLFNFERDFEKFRSQQRVLLAHHNELGH